MRNIPGSTAIWRLELALIGFAAFAGACSSDKESVPAATGGSAQLTGGSSGTGGSSTAGGGATGTFEYKACPEDQHVGGFALQLTQPNGAVPGTSSLNGKVYDRAEPSNVWTVDATEGDCELMVAPTIRCAPSCGAGQTCGGSSCVPAPVIRSVGAVTVTGLVQPLEVMPALDKTYYGPISGAYPPAAPGAALSLKSAGGDYASFVLGGAGITPLEVPPTSFTIEADKPVTLSWTPGVGTQSRMAVSLDIAHHGGVFAEIRCDVPDTGSTVVPGALVTKLLAKGTAGFPIIGFTRRTISATTIAAGCVDFSVASYVERPLNVPGVTSCTCDYGDQSEECAASGTPCPSPGQTCQQNLTCQ